MTYPSSHKAHLEVTRRDLIKVAAASAAVAGTGALALRHGTAQTPAAADVLESLVIDLPGVPESIDPALAYSARDWSIVHAIHDAPVTLTDSGEIVPLAASSFGFPEPTTLEIVLREGLTFHDGTPVTSAAISRSIAHVQASESEAAGLFAIITEVEEVDDLTVHIRIETPAAWLPAQIAVWIVLLPEDFSADQAITNPVGAGPYMFVSQASGSNIVLQRNPNYPVGMAKGDPIAEQVTYRFVTESTTRVADLAAGQAHIITEIPHDQMETIAAQGNTGLEDAVVSSQWIRIATDVSPFDQPEVRQALNYAVDAESIAQALASPESHRIASLFPDERSIAFNPELVPYAYDPEIARALLDEAGLDRVPVELEVTTAARMDIAEAIAAQLGEVGFDVSIVANDYTVFNANWANLEAPALRLVSWGPLYDPQTLLSLAFHGSGWLTRYHNADLDALIDAGAIETDPDLRKAIYADLTQLMFDDAPAVYLWNLAAGYGIAPAASAWQPRGDEYVLPLNRDQAAT